MRPVALDFLSGRELYRTVVLDRLANAQESVWIATANVKAMLIELDGRFVPIVDLFARLAARGVELRLLHAELPSRPFRAAFDRKRRLVEGGLALKICPRVHLKAVLVDGAWLYLGSANLTGAGMGAKGDQRRNFEVGIVTEDFELIDRIGAIYESIWSGAECRTCKLHGDCPDPIGPGPARARRPRRSLVRLGHSRRLGD